MSRSSRVPALALALATLTPSSSASCPPPVQDDTWNQADLEKVTRRIEKQVEELRGHGFGRPVAVRLADKESFLRHAIERTSEHQGADRQAANQAIAQHLGLIPADMDLMEATLALLQDQVGGFYDPGEDTFYLMDSFTGGVAEVILAHELTHALDDQLYDLDGGLDGRVDSSDAVLAYSSVVEGSGTNAMQRWTMRNMDRISLPELTEASSMGTEGLADAPPYLWKPLLATYMKGESFLSAGYKALGKQAAEGSPRPTINAAIDRAFAAPPRSMEQVLHPEKYWDPSRLDEPSVVRHSLEGLPAGWSLLGRDNLGELGIALVATPPDARKGLDASNVMAMMTIQYTNSAASGWDGDEVCVLAREDGARVLHLATTWDSEEDAGEFRASIEAQLPFLLERQQTLAANGSGGWLAMEYADPRQVSYAFWSGCTRADAEILVAGPLSWTEDRPGDSTESQQ